MKLGIRTVAATAVVALAATAVLAAQMELATIRGTVKDEQGQPIAGAVIRLTDAEHGREVRVQTDKNGAFYRRGLQALDYQFVVEKDGYQPIQDTISLSAGLEKRYDFKLAKAAPAGAEEFAAGVAAYNSGDNAAAAAAFEAAAAKAPDIPEIHVNLALTYLRLSRQAEATAELEKATAVAHGDAKTLFLLGGAYVEMNALDRAVAAFEEGIGIQSDISDPLVYDATVTLGAAYFAKGDNDKAAAQFEKAIAARADAVTPRLGLAKVYASRGDVDRALPLFREVVSMAPGTPEATEAAAFIEQLEAR